MISKGDRDRQRFLKPALWAVVVAILYSIYVVGISYSPPGFYVDESGLAYNAYLVSTTGAGEFGGKFPLYFQLYTGGFTQYSNPTQIYLLAILYSIAGPGIVISRMFAAACVFAACLLLGLFAKRVSLNNYVGIIVGLSALATPWLFEVGRLVLETFFYPMAVVALLWSVFYASQKDKWSSWNISAIVASLTLLTYSYTIGRLLAPLLAFGLLVFISDRERFKSVCKVWGIYAFALVPLIVFNIQNPEIRTRFHLISYIKEDTRWTEIPLKFIGRYLQDINPVTLLFLGDTNQRHNLPEAFGSFYVGTFVLAVAGLVVILLHYRKDRWWRYVLFGTAVSVVPGAMTLDPFHTLRMIAYPIFLLTLMIPALTRLLSDVGDVGNDTGTATANSWRNRVRPFYAATILLMALTIAEAAYFHYQYYEHSPKRGYIFDAAYKPLYDQAVSQTQRPIYLIDGIRGPAYIHSLWYATIEGRPTSQFVHLPYGSRAPAGSIVLSTENDCTHCRLIRRNGDYILYWTTGR